MEKEAMEYPDEMNHPWHPKHPLRLLQIASDVVCLSCGVLIKEETMCYSCKICGNFSIHLDCAIREPSPHVPHVAVKFSIHEHPLVLLPREASFTCNACGTNGNVSPLVCISCSCMIHKDDCTHLPSVIRINRHLHRLSHTFSLALDKKFDCGVCQYGIDSRYGAYSSQIDPDFAVHSRCATRKDVWDGIELKDVPDVETLLDPFNVTSEDTIKHFSHEHELRLTNTKDDARCYACNLPVSPDPSYKCVELNCGFILHKTCANLPLKTRCPVHQHTLTLLYKDAHNFECTSCEHVSNGFRYSCFECDYDFDTKCISVAEPFFHGGHFHPLFLSSYSIPCCACNQAKRTELSCHKCEFALCLACATLPRVCSYEDDAHPLSLNHGGRARGKFSDDLNWCDCCETQVNPRKIFYECSTCGINVHVNCAIGGDLRNLRAGFSFNINSYKCKVVPNDQVNRPYCSGCKRRGTEPSMLMCRSEDDYDIVTYFCSLRCLSDFTNRG